MESPKTKITINKEQFDDVFDMISWWEVDKVRNAKVMVVGAGALGNEVLKNLALLNVGTLVAIDFDTVEYANLSRSVLFRESDTKDKTPKVIAAKKRLEEINPETNVIAISGDVGVDVGLGLIRRMDVIISAVDSRLARLYINRLAFKVGVPWIEGGIGKMSGQLEVFKPEVSCYECQMTTQAWANINTRMSCPDLARRYVSAGRTPTTPLAASIIGALQVQEAIKLIHNHDDRSLAGQSLTFSGFSNEMHISTAPPLREICESHFEYDPIREAESLSQNSTFGEILQWCRENLNAKDPVIQLEHPIILKVGGKATEKEYDLTRIKPLTSDQFLRDLTNNADEEFYFLEEVETVDASFPKLNLSLANVGFPPLSIVWVMDGDQDHFIEMSKDKYVYAFADDHSEQVSATTQ